jgi:hypothetical protein
MVQKKIEKPEIKYINIIHLLPKNQEELEGSGVLVGKQNKDQ